MLLKTVEICLLHTDEGTYMQATKLASTTILILFYKTSLLIYHPCEAGLKDNGKNGTN